MATSVWRKFQNIRLNGKIHASGKDISPNELSTLDRSSRVVETTSTSLFVNILDHAERIILVNSNSAGASTFSLPPATGSGAKFTIVNNIVQTQGSIVIAANGTDILTGKAKSFDSTAVTTQEGVFLTSATSDKITFNLTSTGGLGYDTVEAVDVGANTYLVDVECTASGLLTNPFSAT